MHILSTERYAPLEKRLKHVMEQELQVIVKEEGWVFVRECVYSVCVCEVEKTACSFVTSSPFFPLHHLLLIPPFTSPPPHPSLYITSSPYITSSAPQPFLYITSSPTLPLHHLLPILPFTSPPPQPSLYITSSPSFPLHHLLPNPPFTSPPPHPSLYITSSPTLPLHHLLPIFSLHHLLPIMQLHPRGGATYHRGNRQMCWSSLHIAHAGEVCNRPVTSRPFHPHLCCHWRHRSTITAAEHRSCPP